MPGIRCSWHQKNHRKKKTKNEVHEKTIDEIYKNVNLPKGGYQKGDLKLTETQINKAYSGLRGNPTKIKDYFETICSDFQDMNTGTIFDELRHQGAVESKIMEQLSFIYPDLKLESVKNLKSEGKGKRQTWHADFSIFDFPRFAGFVSFQDDKKLRHTFSK